MRPMHQQWQLERKAKQDSFNSIQFRNAMHTIFIRETGRGGTKT